VGIQVVAVIASEADGDFVVVWQGPGSSDPAGVFGRRFNSAGVALAAEFRANSATAGDQTRPAVAMQPGGGFVVTWTSPQDGDLTGVFGQRFGSSGAATGPEFQVNVDFTGSQQNPTIGVDADGDFVIAWEDSSLDASDFGIVARRYDSAGTPLGSPFQVNAVAAGKQRYPFFSTDADGDFVVAWAAYPEPSGPDVHLRRFKSWGQAAGGDLQVNIFTPGDQEGAVIASEGDGDFVVVWNSYGQDGDDYGVFFQRFDVMALADVDGDGQFLPLTDGLLVLRFAFGFTGATLITGAVGPGCTRCNAPSITAHLQDLL
jgi:hypothetical protein